MMIFAREITGPLTSLVKKLDEATAKHKAEKMGSFVVFCTDDEGMRKKLETLIKKENIKHTVLTIDTPAGPDDYDVAKEADVTVVLYVDKTVSVNRAYKKGQFTEKDINRILANLPKILQADTK
ncbi:MAG TPA: hypothetical protein VG013_31385 [Gemmataceae bacterium]|nr:hypothetical protein [Gemmataceae bacterium]